MPLVDMPLDQLKAYAGRNLRPEDHDAYWARALAEMAAVDSDVQLVPHAMNAPYAECFDLYFTGVRGARIHAKYMQPAASAGKHAAGKHPAVLLFHGHTMSSGDWSDKLKWAARGFSVASLDRCGHGGLSEDIGGVKGTTHRGHIIRGLDDAPDNLLFRHIFLDTAQLARIVMEMPGVDPDRVGATGGSQGGGLTLACAALEPRVRRAFGRRR
jgi:cephalosporin-C deacetylase